MVNDIINLKKKSITLRYLRIKGSVHRSISGPSHDDENKNLVCDDIKEILTYKYNHI